jgi:carbonic anhydrase
MRSGLSERPLWLYPLGFDRAPIEAEGARSPLLPCCEVIVPNPLQRLIDGFDRFRRDSGTDESRLMAKLAAAGQRPDVLVIGCSDSRVDPAILTSARPGDLFIVRNVAAIVPPYRLDGVPKGTSSAVEFGVRGLGVQHIAVLGHAACGGMRLLAERGLRASRETSFDFVDDWVEIAAPARRALDLAGLEPLRHAYALEQTSILLSLANLLTFPWIRESVSAGSLALHGWYVDIARGELLAFDAPSRRFVPARGTAHPLTGRAALDRAVLELAGFARSLAGRAA